jgi:hypothetical protein
MNRLERDYPTIRLDTADWANDNRVSAEEQALRQRFVNALEAVWRRDITSGDTPEGQPTPSYEFNLFIPVSGELPTLRTSFNHVAVLALKGAGGHLNLDRFLRSFRRSLRCISKTLCWVSCHQIGHLSQLSYLTLDRCAINLSPATAQTLQSLAGLKHLNLTTPPDTAAGLQPNAPPDQPVTAQHRPARTAPDTDYPDHDACQVDLSQNSLRELPDDAFLAPPAVSAAFDLSANPLSPSTLQRLKSYCRDKGEHWNADVPASQLQRLKALYPSLSERDNKRIFSSCPANWRTPTPISAA